MVEIAIKEARQDSTLETGFATPQHHLLHFVTGQFTKGPETKAQPMTGLYYSDTKMTLVTFYEAESQGFNF